MRGHVSRTLCAAAFAAAVLLVGCGDGATDLQLGVGAGATYGVTNGATPRQAGYTVTVVIEQTTNNARPHCPGLPSDLRLRVGDQEFAPVTDPSTGCLNTPIQLGPYPQVGTVTVDVLAGTHMLAHAEFEGLAPGGGATLAVPADGQVHAGDEIIVVPPAELSAGADAPDTFYALDDPNGPRLFGPQAPRREADGMHAWAPAFTGRAALTFFSQPFVPQASYTCPGFDFCIANADHTLGPVFVTETP